VILYFDQSRAVAFRSNHVRSFFELKIQTPWGEKCDGSERFVQFSIQEVTSSGGESRFNHRGEIIGNK
jgi:hypothetical protein